MCLCPGNPGQHHHHHRPLPLQRPLHLHQPPQQPRRHRHPPPSGLPSGLRVGEAGGGHGVVHTPHTGSPRHQGQHFPATSEMSLFLCSAHDHYRLHLHGGGHLHRKVPRHPLALPEVSQLGALPLFRPLPECVC